MALVMGGQTPHPKHKGKLQNGDTTDGNTGKEWRLSLAFTRLFYRFYSTTTQRIWWQKSITAFSTHSLWLLSSWFSFTIISASSLFKTSSMKSSHTDLVYEYLLLCRLQSSFTTGYTPTHTTQSQIIVKYSISVSIWSVPVTTNCETIRNISSN